MWNNMYGYLIDVSLAADSRPIHIDGKIAIIATEVFFANVAKNLIGYRWRARLDKTTRLH